MNKITRLTKDQKKAILGHVKKWIAMGLSTEPADFKTFEDNVLECYKYANLNTNIPIIRVKSPIVGAIASSIAREIIGNIKTNSSVDSSVDSVVVSAVRSAVDSAVRSAVHSDVYSAVGSEVGLAVDSAVGSAVHSAVHSAVDSSVDSAVGSEVGLAVDSAVRSAVHSAVNSNVYLAVRSAVYSEVGSKNVNIKWHDWFGGSFWAGWQAYIDFYFSVCELDIGEELNNRRNAYMKTQMSAGYWWCNSNFIMVSDRPEFINLDDNGRLHNNTGMSIRWRDGWGFYHINGVVIPSYVVTNPEKITVDIIKKETNAEVRRIMIERFDVSKYLVEIGAKIIDMDSLSLQGSSPRALMEDDKGDRYLIGSDGSTGRVYHMIVDNDIKTCKDAHSLLAGFSEDLIIAES